MIAFSETEGNWKSLRMNHLCGFFWEGVFYTSVWQAFQASRLITTALRQQYVKTPWRIHQNFDGWESRIRETLTRISSAKFAQNWDYLQDLYDTESNPISYLSNDTRLGTPGENLYGKALEEARYELRGY